MAGRIIVYYGTLRVIISQFDPIGVLYIVQ